MADCYTVFTLAQQITSTNRIIRFTPVEEPPLVDENCNSILKSNPSIMKQARKVICTNERFYTPKVNLLESLNFCEVGLKPSLFINTVPTSWSTNDINKCLENKTIEKPIC